MATDYAGGILLLLRRIIRSIDRHNKQLSRKTDLTVPQMFCLRHLHTEGRRTISQLAEDVFLSKATLTGIVDRLERKGLLERDRSISDRRKVFLVLTEEGAKLAREVPFSLQEKLSSALGNMNQEQIEQIFSTLTQLMEMMEAPELTVWPHGSEDSVPQGAEIVVPEAIEPLLTPDITNEN